MNAPVKPKLAENKFNTKTTYLISYLQKQKMKM